MAGRGRNEVTLTFAGDSSQLEGAFARVGAAAGSMDNQVGRASRNIARESTDGFDRAGEAADNAENKAQGFASTLEGSRDVAVGFGELARGNVFDGLVTLGGGFADLAEGINYTVVPALKGAWTMIRRSTVATRLASVATRVWTGVQAALNLVMSANPLALVVAAVAALTAAIIIAYRRSETFRRIVDGVFRSVARIVGRVVVFLIDMAKAWLDMWLTVLERILRGVARFVRIFRPAWADAMDRAADKVKGFREDANRQLDRVKKTVRFDADTGPARDAIRNLQQWLRGRHFGPIRIPATVMLSKLAGDGPGRTAAGSAIARARALAGGLPVSLTSGYRTAAENAAAGGSPTSYHRDRANPAGDWGGPTWALDELHRRMVNAGGWRELFWRVAGHYDHVHAARFGGNRSGWTLVGEDGPELAKLPVGSRVIPNAASRRMGGDQAATVVNIDLGGRRIAQVLIDPLRREVKALGGVQAAFGTL